MSKKYYGTYWGRNSVVHTFGKNGGFRYLNFPRDIHSYITYNIQLLEMDLLRTQEMYNLYSIKYRNAKGVGTSKFSYNKSSIEYKEWLVYKKEIYQLKRKVIEYANEIKMIKCRIKQTNALLSLYDAKKI